MKKNKNTKNKNIWEIAHVKQTKRRGKEVF
jgi:hypothetical protein